MKRVFAVVFAAASCLSLTACGGSSEADTPATVTVTAPGTTVSTTSTVTHTTTATTTAAPTEAPAAEPAAEPAVAPEANVDADTRPMGLVAPAPAPAPAAPVRSAYYANCAEVRAAGAAPIHRGEAGYSSKLDRDGDGVACE